MFSTSPLIGTIGKKILLSTIKYVNKIYRLRASMVALRIVLFVKSRFFTNRGTPSVSTRSSVVAI